MKIMRIKCLTVLFIALTLISCDGGGNNSSNNSGCDPFLIAFSPIPECMTDYLLTNWIRCECTGEESEFDLFLLNVEIDGFNGHLSENGINWEALSCTAISFTGETSGMLQNMTVPETSLLEFSMTLDDSAQEQVSCCCGDALVVD